MRGTIASIYRGGLGDSAFLFSRGLGATTLTITALVKITAGIFRGDFTMIFRQK